MVAHPLDREIEEVEEYLGYTAPVYDFQRKSEYRLSEMLVSLSGTDADDSCISLCFIAARAHRWLRDLGVDDPWQEMRGEYDLAKAHNVHALDSSRVDESSRFFFLVEKMGKVANALNYFSERKNLEPELIRIGELALSWLAYIHRKETAK